MRPKHVPKLSPPASLLLVTVAAVAVERKKNLAPQKFRNKIVVQIETLTNHEARLVDNDDGSYTIYNVD